MRTEKRHYPVLHYSWNNDRGVLTDVTYTPWTDEHIRSVNRDPATIGEVGTIEGTVRSGGQSSRLFHATAHRAWPVGEPQSFDWFTADRDVRDLGNGEFSYTRCTCG